MGTCHRKTIAGRVGGSWQGSYRISLKHDSPLMGRQMGAAAIQAAAGKRHGREARHSGDERADLRCFNDPFGACLRTAISLRCTERPILRCILHVDKPCGAFDFGNDRMDLITWMDRKGDQRHGLGQNFPPGIIVCLAIDIILTGSRLNQTGIPETVDADPG